MRRWALAALLAAACHRSAPPPAAPCQPPPRVLAADELEEVMRRFEACADHECRATLRAELRGVLVPYSVIGHVTARPRPPSDSALDELRALEARACACADKACADAVQADVAAWETKHADTNVSHADAEEAKQRSANILVCLLSASR